MTVSTRRGIALAEGIELHLVREKRKRGVGLVGQFEPTPGSITVPVGDVLRLLTDQPVSASDAGEEQAGDPWIACLQAGVLEALRVGHHVDIDDGHIVTRVEAVDASEARLRVLTTRRPEERVRADQGLNFPDSPIRGQGFGPDDLIALDVAADIADIVGLSFAQTPEDVNRLIDELDARGAHDTGVIAKIETQSGIECLPDIIVAGAARRPFGVMIAPGRSGDRDRIRTVGRDAGGVALGVRGRARSGHLGDSGAGVAGEDGIPTRAELTDAAMGERAECVMLNKGPHILDGVDTLVDVLVRMETHQSKKTPRLRALQSW